MAQLDALDKVDSLRKSLTRCATTPGEINRLHPNEDDTPVVLPDPPLSPLSGGISLPANTAKVVAENGEILPLPGQPTAVDPNSATAWAAALLYRLSGHSPNPAAQLVLAGELRRATSRCLTAFVRGAAAGATLKGGLHLLAFALVLLSRFSPPRRRGPAALTGASAAAAAVRPLLLRSRHAAALPAPPLALPALPQLPAVRRNTTVKTASKDTARYAAFLGAVGGIYVAVDEALALIFGRQRYGAVCVADARPAHSPIFTF